jgi:hypothetical protein
LVPGATETLPGVTAIATRAIEFTFSVAAALIVPRLAVIELDPPLKPLANPAVVMPATDSWEELQFTELVRF